MAANPSEIPTASAPQPIQLTTPEAPQSPTPSAAPKFRTWAEIKNLPEVRDLSNDDLEAVRAHYFETVVKPQFQDPGDLEAVQAYFDQQTRPSTGAKILRTTGQVLDSVTEAAKGAADTAASGARFAISGIKSMMPQAPTLDDLFLKHGTANGVDPELLRGIANAETGHIRDPEKRRKAVSPKGASGLMQFMPATAARFKVLDPTNEDQAIAGAAKYMRFLLDRYDGDKEKAVAAYNAGEGNVDKYGGIPPFKETQNYVLKVLGPKSARMAPDMFGLPVKQEGIDAVKAEYDAANPASRATLLADTGWKGRIARTLDADYQQATSVMQHDPTLSAMGDRLEDRALNYRLQGLDPKLASEQALQDIVFQRPTSKLNTIGDTDFDFERAAELRNAGPIEPGAEAYGRAQMQAREGNVDKYGGIPPFQETQEYVPAVFARWDQWKKQQSPTLGDYGRVLGDATVNLVPETMAGAGRVQLGAGRALRKAMGIQVDREGPITSALQSVVDWLSETVEQNRQSAYEGMTPAGREQLLNGRMLDETVDPQTGDVSYSWGEHPVRAAASSLLQSAPGFVAMGGLGRAASLGMSGLGLTTERVAAEAVKRGVPEWMARWVGHIVTAGAAYGGTEGLISGAQDAEQAYQDIMGRPLAEFEQAPAWRAVFMDETDRSLPLLERAEQARRIVAERAAAEVGLKSGAVVAATSGLTGGGALGMLDAPAKSVGGGFVKGGLSEAMQEVPQSGYEQFAQNQAVQEYADPNQRLMEGVPNALATGGVVGFALGGPMGALSRRAPQEQAGETTNGEVDGSVQRIHEGEAEMPPDPVPAVEADASAVSAAETSAKTPAVSAEAAPDAASETDFSAKPSAPSAAETAETATPGLNPADYSPEEWAQLQALQAEPDVSDSTPTATGDRPIVKG
jgi:hypothetical protein